jgi:hypothetical protein
MDKFDKSISYPGKAPELAQFIKTHYPVHQSKYENCFDRQMDRQFLVEMLEPAKQFMQQNEVTLYCGEFGVIDQAPMQTRINWTRDFIDVLDEYKIGFAYWCYKQMDFGLVDQNSNLINEELLRIVTLQD